MPKRDRRARAEAAMRSVADWLLRQRMDIGRARVKRQRLSKRRSSQPRIRCSCLLCGQLWHGTARTVKCPVCGERRLWMVYALKGRKRKWINGYAALVLPRMRAMQAQAVSIKADGRFALMSGSPPPAGSVPNPESAKSLSSKDVA